MSQTLGLKVMTVLFKIQGYVAKDIYFERKNNRIIIETKRVSEIVNSCLYPHSRYDSTIQDILIGSFFGSPVYARLQVYRYHCDFCGVKSEGQTISEGKKRYSKGMEFEIIRHTALMDNKSVSRLLGLSTRTVYRIDFNGLEKLMKRYEPKIESPPEISVDEVSYKKRHKYATILTNYSDARVIWLEKNRKSIDLKRAYKKFGEDISNIKTVAVDFWAAYEKATRNMIPDAAIIFDKFHLSKILNRKVEAERREYQNQLPEEERKRIKRNARWLMLKRKKNMKEDNLTYLEELKRTNEPLYDIYLLKETFLDIFNAEKTREDAKKEMLEWIDTVNTTNFTKLKQFTRSVQKRLDTLLNWFDHPISNAKSEGVNNVIKSILKRSYGFKNFDYFRMKVLQKCGYLMQHLPAEKLNGI